MKNKIIIVLIVIMTFVAGTFFYLIYQNKQKVSQLNQNSLQKEETNTQKQTPKNEKQANRDFIAIALADGIYSYNIKNKNQESLVDFSNIGSDPVVDTGQFNKEDKLAYSISGYKNSQVFIFDKITGTKKLLTTNPENFYNKNFSWSEENSLVYQALTDINENPYATNSWNIYINKEDGEEKLVAQGISPIFLSSNKIAFLKQDGIYILDIKTEDNQAYSIWKTKRLFNSKDSYLTISKDKKIVALKESDKISIFRVSDWEKTSILENPKEIEVEAILAIFSEDGKSLVVKGQDQNLKTYSISAIK